MQLKWSIKLPPPTVVVTRLFLSKSMHWRAQLKKGSRPLCYIAWRIKELHCIDRQMSTRVMQVSIEWSSLTGWRSHRCQSPNFLKSALRISSEGSFVSCLLHMCEKSLTFQSFTLSYSFEENSDLLQFVYCYQGRNLWTTIYTHRAWQARWCATWPWSYGYITNLSFGIRTSRIFFAGHTHFAGNDDNVYTWRAVRVRFDFCGGPSQLVAIAHCTKMRLKLSYDFGSTKPRKYG